jgi:membrane-associated protease RseP (regulator of RpoE activity)
MKRLFPIVLAILLLPHSIDASQHRKQNPALLGVVTALDRKGVRVLHVLPESPASRIGIKRDDVILQIGKTTVGKPEQVDRALRDFKAGDTVDVVFQRGKKNENGTAKLVARSSYRGDIRRGPSRGATGFKAPEWYAYAFGNVTKEQKQPTLAVTKGKIIVIHAFQSW